MHMHVDSMRGMMDLQRDLHIRYFTNCLNGLPGPYKSLDTNRVVLVYFAVSALDILGALDSYPHKQSVIDWIYSHQVVQKGEALQGSEGFGGFIGGGFTGPLKSRKRTSYHKSHVSMTYSALLTLAILGDDLGRVNKEAICMTLKTLQREDGCFQAVEFGSETDLRFVFCAAAISFMLQDWSGMDLDAAEKFILSNHSFDGGFGLLPGQESHGGSTYCACAALKLMGRLDKIPRKALLRKFLASRQVGGFNGRVNKPPDTCYTFWVGGAMQILGDQDVIDKDSTREFLLKCQQNKVGGFSKLPGVHPDILHSYFSVCGFALMNEPGFPKLEAVLGISRRAFDRSPFANGVDPDGNPVVT